MKLGLFLVTLFSAVCLIFAYVPTVQRPRPGGSFPTFSGQRPFNPKARWPKPLTRPRF
ncbi:abaecin [Calliopsis andreniformis]|uniref:abaecin n=1 Tax=Calliopsis andreniformis TaxID=337506 RepID=UPI003FCE83FD